MACWAVLLLVGTFLNGVLGQTISLTRTLYSVDFDEEQPLNTPVTTLRAIGFGPNSNFVPVMFALPNDGDAGNFSIDNLGQDLATGESTAILRSAVVFDWDQTNTQNQFSFSITASIMGTSTTRTVLVSVQILDINDNSPQFSRDSFYVHIPELQAAGVPILNASAVDPDQVLFETETVVIDPVNNVVETRGRYTVVNGLIAYSIIGGNDLGHFRLDSMTGLLFVVGGARLDVDEVSLYNLTIAAVDGGGRNNTAEVYITILDSNDNAPVILSPIGVDVSVSEEASPGYLILTSINSTDADSGANAEVRYSIVGGDSTGSFSIDEATGRIEVSGPLDREVVAVYNLAVAARDQGSPSLQDTINVVVRLLDVNDYAPRFPQASYTANVVENTRADVTVTRVVADDLDEGTNGTVTYSIVDGGFGYFYIDPSSGDVLTNRSLDREERSSYILIIQASDNPQNLTFQLTSQVNVTVLVDDINDNQPIFVRANYSMEILDNVTTFQPILRVEATDADSGVNRQVIYSIEEGDPAYPGAFRIDPSSGLVFRSGRLSYQNQSRFSYFIGARDNGQQSQFAVPVPLVIILHDVNENPPMFNPPSYNNTIGEDTRVGTVVVTVNASDPDSGDTGRVRYRVPADQFDEAGSFEVDELSGEVRVASPLDFDARNVIRFIVEAYDGGFPQPFTDLANVTILLTGLNDEAPLIVFPSGFQLLVPENVSPEVDIAVLREFTVDPDVGHTGDFLFELAAIYDDFSDNASFSLNETTGLLRSLRTFDREEQPNGIVITVTTIDFEDLTRDTNLTVVIGDMNDRSPYFEYMPEVTVYEFLPPGTEILSSFMAVDEDIGSNAELRYFLSSSSDLELFTMDASSGGLFTSAVLNKTIQDSYNVSVLVMDQGVPPLFGYGSILVTVLDFNDMTPVFSFSVYEVFFPESSTPGYLVALVNATDSDEGTNSDIRYSLQFDNSTLGRFRIDQLSGAVVTEDTFDREVENVVELMVVAVDGGMVPHPLTGTATIRIVIEDVNDNIPVFNESRYEATVVENAPLGSSVASVLAVDADATSPNNHISYSLRGNRSEALGIDSLLGEIFVAGEVDWEAGAEFTVEVVATDLNNSNGSLSSSVPLRVQIVNVNDNAPKFVPSSLNLTIQENSSPDNGNISVGFVVAIDADTPGNSSAITFAVVMDFSNGKFSLDPERGEVFFVRGNLNRERRELYDLEIRASDNGYPVSHHTDARLFIEVSDANDFDPVFVQEAFSASVAERASIGTSVLAVLATDNDEGSNSELRYTFINFTGGEFFINETTGVVSVFGVLDFDNEATRSFSIPVLVSDQGLPSRNDTALISIAVTDSNDLSPVFLQPVYFAVIRENLASGTVVERVTAFDNDTVSEDTAISYSILESPGSGNLGIDSITGVTYTTTSLNREEFGYYNLTILANNSLSLHPLWTTVQLVVMVTDLNDEHPTLPSVVEVLVFENETVGSVVHVLNAVDNDEADNGTVEYFLLQPSDFFSLNMSTGALSLTRSLDREGAAMVLILPVVMNDLGSPSLVNYTNVVVRVQDSNDNPPQFAAPDYSVTVSSVLGIGTTFLRLEVRDDDVGSNAEVATSITSGNSLGLFGISMSGDLFSAADLTPYRGRTFPLTVQASDGVLASFVNVTVNVLGVASTLPRFVMTGFSANVLENQAQDGDEVFDFSSSVLNANVFSVNVEFLSIDGNGRLTLANASFLDFERQPVHQVTITIGQLSSQDTSHEVLILNVVDDNDIAPAFVADTFFVWVPETVPVGDAVFTAAALDKDGTSSNSFILYDLDLTADAEARARFTIDGESGVVQLANSLDYEDGPTFFNLTLRATNSRGSPPLSSIASLEVNVLNGNSFSPMFAVGVLNLAFPENVSAGLNIANWTATDLDVGSSGNITYGLHGDHRYLDFRIDTFTGSLFINEQFDYERSPSYSLTVVASDGGNPARSSTAIVQVDVLDLNDNSPVWDQELYSVSLLESTEVGTSVIQVRATDRDSVGTLNDVVTNRNGYVTYSIARGDPSSFFAVDPDTGMVTVASSLDREAHPTLNLTLIATDGPGLFASAYLQVVIHDVNDVVPTFSQNPYNVALSEHAPEGTLVATVSAMDTDLRSNSEVRYFFSDDLSVSSEDSTLTFSINDTSGRIFLEELVDREVVPRYTLTVVAVDAGDVPLTGTTQVIVELLDINEFAPIFSLDSFYGEVFENSLPQTSVLQVNASDVDFGENGTVFYSILPGNGSVFAIDSTSGIISVSGPIDFEIDDLYQLVVLATDAAPDPSLRLTSSVNVTVRILDVNDNPPAFVGLPYMAIISENSNPGDYVLNASATDSDSGSNAALSYTLIFPDEETRSNFEVDSSSGTLTVASSASLDRETIPSFNFTITVADNGSSVLNSSTIVMVMLEDENDNVPQFSSPFYEGRVRENLPPGTTVTAVSAEDGDSGSNANLTFSMGKIVAGGGDCAVVGQLDERECAELLASDSPLYGSPFQVDSVSGEISTAELLDRENTSSYILEIFVRDGGEPQPFTNMTFVLIEVLDDNDQIPIFSQEVYSANISEHAQSGVMVTQVEAVDFDAGINAEITYTLFGSSGKFTVNPISGEILTTAGDFDRETVAEYSLTVIASDGAAPSMSSSATIVVTLLDENDSPPVFAMPSFSASVVENGPPREFVLQLNASDADAGSNADLTFSIASSSPQNHFEVNSSGALYTSQPLDRERFPVYTLVISAADGGTPPLFATVSVEVTVVDENDSPPAFIGAPYVRSLDENSLPSEPILNIVTFDVDIGSNGLVYYSIINVSPLLNNTFEVNSTSGEITLLRSLDAEESLSYNITVRADNGNATPPQSSETVVVLNVADLNDNAPVFGQTDYAVPFLESNPVSAVVIQLTASDGDSTSPNSDLVFEITGGRNRSLFSISSPRPGVGVVSVAMALDREAEPEHMLEVSVFDGGSPRLSESTLLTIVLQDANDNSPVFGQSSYSFSLVENSPLPTLVGTIRASDLDLENVSYSLVDTSVFSVDPDSGEIYTAVEIDREVQAVHTITAVASDSGTSEVGRNTSVIVNVTVLDFNDNQPVFSNSTYLTQTFENTSLFATVLTVGAFDIDSGENGDFTYSIVSGNDSSFFAINSTSGDISLVMELDRERQGAMVFYVMATDHGTPALSSTALVVVMVLDNNDNNPALSSLVYSAALPENSPAGTFALQVNASDLDIDDNADISYSLHGDFDNTFEIGMKSGIISLVGSLDYELTTNYSFDVVASDNGVYPLSSSSLVVIKVLDLNDNPPVFDSNMYRVSIPENAVLDTSVFQIPATDADSTTNGELRYSIYTGNLRSAFSLDEETGLVVTADPLDREITDSYLLTITATDQGMAPFTATAELLVSILDINDHAPSFTMDAYSVSVLESAARGTSILRLEASDSDTIPNANFTYRIVAGGGEFALNTSTGELLLTSQLDVTLIPSYALTVLVSDNGYPEALFDTVIVRVTVLDDNTNAPHYDLSSYHINISQSVPVGSPIGRFHATDEDLGLLTYSLVGAPNQFIVNALDGTVYVNVPLELGLFSFTLVSSDGQLAISIRITVAVVATSDTSAARLFEAPSYYFEIPESAEVGTVVGRVSPAGRFVRNSTRLFSVETNGDIVVAAPLDAELIPFQVLNVIGGDLMGGDPVYVVAAIRVMDVNDNPPRFESEVYGVVLPETALPGTSLVTLQTFDRDSSLNNSAIALTLSSQGNEGGSFILDERTGVLSLNGSLDYETVSSYNLTVVAVNYLGSPVLSSSAQVLVFLTDVNDNSPQFTQPFYQVSIPESLPVGTEILRLDASDPDSGSNSELVYSITYSSLPQAFSVNRTSGAISTNIGLEENTFTVAVRVADRGTPQPLASSTLVFVEATPVNSAPPVFSQPEGYSVVVPETLTAGDQVLQVVASDEDTIILAIITPDARGTFAIDSLTGVVTLTRPLDFNEQSFYSLLVEATDGASMPLSSVVVVNVTVEDINNHVPVFDRRTYQVSLLENATIGASVVTVGATDEDSVALAYSITANYRNARGEAAFTINSTSGEIKTSALLDAEADSRIEILVTAIDSGYEIIRSNSIPVVVSMLDVNDNAPVFPAASITAPLLRLLSTGMRVARIEAIDADISSSNITYEITSDDSGGLFEIDTGSGVIVTRMRVGDNLGQLDLQVSAFDGVFTSFVQVLLVPENNGDFCEDNGYCTSVRQVDCTVDFIRQIQCIPLCGDASYALSPAQQVCVRYNCLNSSLVPCVATESCLPQGMACDGTCPSGMSVCPTTDVCHPNTFVQSCDSTGITCLTGRSLVQISNGTRYCFETAALPTPGQSCGNDSVYCEELGMCMELSAPDLCQACPGVLVQCPTTGECVTDLVRCCSTDELYCEVLSTCLDVNLRCELPNIAPVNLQELYYLGTLSNYSAAETSIPWPVFEISDILGNGTHLALDSQDEELSIAITGASDLSPPRGEWQFSLLGTEEWTGIDPAALSNANALLLPSTAQLRHVRTVIELDGAVWLRVKLWDGNEDGYISSNDSLVRSADPSFASTLPYLPNGAFSGTSSLLAVLVLPLNSPPLFQPSSSSWRFEGIAEDISVGTNLGDVLSDVLSPVYLPNFAILSTSAIEGFPSVGVDYEQLLPAEARGGYFEAVAAVNPTRVQRQMASLSGQQPGVGVAFDPVAANDSGVWQVTMGDNLQLFVNLNTVLTSHSTAALLDYRARLRFLPAPNFCGQASVLLAAWDGVLSGSIAPLSPGGYVTVNLPLAADASSTSTLSRYNLGSWEKGVVSIQCMSDPPVMVAGRIQTSVIPYQLVHTYSRLFTVLVDREVAEVRQQTGTLAVYLQIVLLQPVVIKRMAPTPENRTMVSFSVENSALEFSDVSTRISQSLQILSALDFSIFNISQAASYGPGANCRGPEALEYYGDTANSLAAAIGGDVEEETLGLAVVGASSSSRGVWQYQRGSWLQPGSLGPWANFPPRQLTASGAFLLHGSDRVRFTPYPEYFWNDRSPPQIQVKLWDMSSSYHLLPLTEQLAIHGNTDPTTDTLRSLHRPVGLFSDDTAVVVAARWGCDSVVNSGLVHDACCECGGTGGGCRGCDDASNSNALFDSCNVCGGSSSSCLGCDLIPFSESVQGPCGECLSTVNMLQASVNISVTDCNEDCYGTALLDDCGVCSSGNTNHVFNSDQDCTGACFGGASMDSCGDCTGPGTNRTSNENLDCTGVCGGLYREDTCGVCQLPASDGAVREFRDCSGDCFGTASLDSCGVCYGGRTGVSEGSALDACGVCYGDDSTCTGCDGVVNSNKTVDRCGECGGNNCGCFLLQGLVPNIGPLSGGTSVQVQGAGLFLNDTSLVSFQFDRDSPNCGAPARFADSSIISILCRFRSPSQQLSAQALPVNQGFVLCTAPVSMSPGVFMLEVSVSNGPFSAPLEFTYYDQSTARVLAYSPAEWLVSSSPMVSFTGEGFINTSSASCLIYNSHMCRRPQGLPPQQGYVSVPAQYVSSAEMACILSVATIPCLVSLRLSMDGQESGTVSSLTNDQFFYRFSSPEVIRTSFLEDSSGVLFEFDRQVSSTPTDFSCMDVFVDETFARVGGAGASCRWLNARQDQMVLTLPANASIQVGSPITFRDGTLLTRGQLYSFSTRNLTVVVENFPSLPVAVINGPSSIPYCGQFSFTGANSQHPGYGGFRYLWSILVEDTAIDGYLDLQRYLISLDLRTASTITLNSASFLPSQPYYINLQVTNALGQRSSVESLRVVKDSEPAPDLYIVGPANRSLQAVEDLLLESVISVPECLTLAEVQFEWELIRVVDLRRNITITEYLATVRRGSHQVFIPSRHFEEGFQYEVRVRVQLVGSSPLAAASAVVMASVMPRRLVARIHGGDRTVSSQRLLVLDARNSSFSSSSAPPTFSWRCEVIGSANACFNATVQLPTPQPIALPRDAYVTFPSSALASSSSYRLTLRLEQAGTVDEASVMVTVVDTSVPIVEVGSNFMEVLASEELSLFGFVYSVGVLESVQWQSVLIEGQGVVDLLSPVAVQMVTDSTLPASSSLTVPSILPQTNTVNRINLVISPHTLNPDLQYTFRLTATNSEGSSSAEVTVQANSPPRFAILEASPLTGTALGTEFDLVVSGALDSVLEMPLLYQFGIILRESLTGIRYATGQGELFVQWLSSYQVSPAFRTVLPSGAAAYGYGVELMARVYDRNGGFADIFSNVTVFESSNVTTELFTEGITGVESSLNNDKDWGKALAQISTYSVEINKHSSVVQTSKLKEMALRSLIGIHDNYLPVSSIHFSLATSIFSSLTADLVSSNDNLKRNISQKLRQASLWYRNETSLLHSFRSIPLQTSNEPLQLQGGYLAPEREILSEADASALLFPWSQILNESNMDSQIQVDFLQAVESVGYTFCQQLSTGEKPSSVNLPTVNLHSVVAPPIGRFNASGHGIDLGSSVVDVYESQACVGTGIACSETCFVAATFPNAASNDPSSAESMQLVQQSFEKVISEIEGSDPTKLKLVSSVVSVSLSIPSEQSYLTVQNLSRPIDILIPVASNTSQNESVLLCLFRKSGGEFGFENMEWEIDDTSSPALVKDGSEDFYLCRFNHLTDFAVGLLPPPVITDPPTTVAVTTPTSAPTTAVPLTDGPTTEEDSTPLPIADPPVGIIVGAIIIVMLLVAVIIVILLIFLMLWKQKKKKMMKVAPEESSNVEKEPVELVQAGPLTPAESKVLMDIIQCMEEGKRTRLGKLNVLPSIRLRELRHEIMEHFSSLKNKPFYFLTRQLSDIEPTTEQQQFVSIVYGDKPIFIREVVSESMITKKHFCICGNAAQLECSNCSSQGYCSVECQNKHWGEKHQKECGRLSERKRRADVLYNRQSTTLSPQRSSLSPISETSPRPSVAGGVATGTSPVASDWKSFMQNKRTSTVDTRRSSLFPPPARSRTLSLPSGNATTLGGLSREMSLPQPDRPARTSLIQPVTSTPAALKPLKNVPLTGEYGAGQSSADHPSMSRMSSVVGTLAPIAPRKSLSLNQSIPQGQDLAASPQAVPQPQPQKQSLFTRRQPPQELDHPPPQPPMRHLSIQSLGSPISPIGGFMSEPLREALEEGREGTISRLSTDSKPPSLAVRKKGQRKSESSSESSLTSSDLTESSDEGGAN